MGPEAAELIGTMALAIKLEATIHEVQDMTCIHPTLSEVIKEAALDTENRSIHRMKQ
jgi:dihydrolipoamide dehydrogenase